MSAPSRMPLLCLASASPRRRQLLAQIGVPHVVRVAGIDESALPGERAADYVLRMARAKALAIDGWMALFANIPPKERRGLIVIDPPYEEGVEFTRLFDTLAQAHRKWASGLYLLWYPIKAREAPDALARRLRRLPVPKILRCELSIAPPRAEGALAGSGLIIVNPPFPLEHELRVILPVLRRLLAPMGCYRLDWLSGE